MSAIEKVLLFAFLLAIPAVHGELLVGMRMSYS
jgi:hypothetical protein